MQTDEYKKKRIIEYVLKTSMTSAFLGLTMDDIARGVGMVRAQSISFFRQNRNSYFAQNRHIA